MLNIKTSGGYTRSYKLRLIESSGGSSTPLPKLNFDSRLVMASSILDRILSDIEVVSDKITIETTEGKQVVCSTRGDSGEATITLDDKSNIENLDEISVTKPSKATYSSEYISKIVKAVGASSEKVTVEFTSKMPLRLAYFFSKCDQDRVLYGSASRGLTFQELLLVAAVNQLLLCKGN